MRPALPSPLSLCLALLLPVAGCAWAEAPPDDQIASDIEQMSNVITSLGTSAQSMEAAAASGEWCYPLYMGCDVCYSLSGNALSGEGSITVDPLPCSITYTFGARSLTTSLTEYNYSGTWDGTLAGDYVLEFAGERGSEVVISGTRWDGSYDSSVVVDSGTATYENDMVTSWDLAFHYISWAGHEWTVTTTFDGTTYTGSASRDDDAVNCTISGSPGNITVACE